MNLKPLFSHLKRKATDSMRISWGVKIAVLYISFVVLILAMVVFSLTRNSPLVKENYYEEEIKYQQQIDRLKRTKTLSEEIKYQQIDGGMMIKFPEEIDVKNIKGDILLYRPSDEKKDFKLSLNLDTEREQTINIAKLDKGFWRIKLNWVMYDVEYYDESHFYIK